MKTYFKVIIIAVFAVGSFAGGAFAYKEYISNKNAKREGIVRAQKLDYISSLQPMDIIMLGDSLTEKGMFSEHFPNLKISNRGIGGDTTADILSRLDKINVSGKRVYLMAGINDIMQNQSPSEIKQNYTKILDGLNGAQVIVQSTLYTRRPKLNPAVEELNEFLKAECSKRDLEFIDLNLIMSENKMLKKEFTWDGIHITGGGIMLGQTI